MTREQEDQPVHCPRPGPSKSFHRFVRNVEIDLLLNEWLERFIQGGQEAAGPYPYDLWRERYFGTSGDEEGEAPHQIITSTRRTGVFAQRYFDKLAQDTAEAFQWTYTWDPSVYGFSAEEKTWRPDVADNGSSVDNVDGARSDVEGDVRKDHLPAVQSLDEADEGLEGDGDAGL
jgi:hypothetical protein